MGKLVLVFGTLIGIGATSALFMALFGDMEFAARLDLAFRIVTFSSISAAVICWIILVIVAISG